MNVILFPVVALLLVGLLAANYDNWTSNGRLVEARIAAQEALIEAQRGLIAALENKAAAFENLASERAKTIAVYQRAFPVDAADGCVTRDNVGH